MKIVVIGGKGLIGSKLVTKLREGLCQVRHAHHDGVAVGVRLDPQDEV